MQNNHINRKIFRTYDIRGIYPKEIDEAVVFWVCSNAIKIFKKGKKIILGRDGRNSSLSLFNSAYLGLKDAGFDVTSIGISTTPMSAFALNNEKADGAIMITASHNPKEFNGIKVFTGKGDIIGGEDILKMIGPEKLNKKTPSFWQTEIVREEDIKKLYASFLYKFLDIKKRVKIIADCSNGATSLILKEFLKLLHKNKKIELILMNENMDGNFPSHGPDPLKKGSINQIKKEIIEKNADFGVVFDGDGDRAVFVDDKGRRIESEFVWRLLILSGKFKKTVYTTDQEFLIKKLSEELSPNNFSLKMSKIGRYFVSQEMKLSRSDLGIESSGHYYFRSFSDSGLLAMIYFINCASLLPYGVSSFVDLLPGVYSREMNFKIHKLEDGQMVKKIKNIFPLSKIKTFDGVSVYLKNSFINFRFSNTQDLLRITLSSDLKSEFSKIEEKIGDFF